jgi:hypothetical protein
MWFQLFREDSVVSALIRIKKRKSCDSVVNSFNGQSERKKALFGQEQCEM